MAVVEPGYGAYLRSNARYTTAQITGAATTWGDKGQASTIVSPIALKADADTEVVRQAQFLAGPMVKDRHVVKGKRRDLIGKAVVVQADRLGYAGGAVAFVIAASETPDGTTTLTVLKRL